VATVYEPDAGTVAESATVGLCHRGTLAQRVPLSHGMHTCSYPTALTYVLSVPLQSGLTVWSSNIVVRAPCAVAQLYTRHTSAMQHLTALACFQPVYLPSYTSANTALLSVSSVQFKLN